MERIRIGSEEHKRLFCRTFVDTHDGFRPSEIVWPELDGPTLERLKALPVWNEAARTEAATAVKVDALGRIESDPELAEAILLQGFEEARHSQVIGLLTRRYQIPVAPHSDPEVPKDPTWAFLRTGYGECLDSFFAFGLYALTVRMEFVPSQILSIFETIMQEEARHTLFIVNWAAYVRARRPAPLRPAFDLRRAWNVGAQTVDRIRGAMRMTPNGNGASGTGAQDGFTLKSHASFSDFSLKQFLELCLAENARRFAPYDERLLRPTLVPAAVRTVVRLLRDGRPATVSA